MDEAAKLPILSLAYVGDSIYELKIRSFLVTHHPGKHPSALHQRAVQYVSAEGQKRIFTQLLPALSEAEKEWVRRGRNANKMSVAKHASPEAYRLSTGIEALFGYLWLSGQHRRVEELFAIIEDIMRRAEPEGLPLQFLLREEPV